MSGESVWAYVGRMTATTKHHKIGTVVCATVDRPEYAKDTAKALSEWVRNGLTIERVPVEWVRKYLFTTEPYVQEHAP